MGMTFWDTVRGHHLADVLIRELPRLNRNLEQMNNQPETVTVAVRGGVAEIVKQSDNVQVSIVDYDSIDETPFDVNIMEVGKGAYEVQIIDKHGNICAVRSIPENIYHAGKDEAMDYVRDYHADVLQSLPY